MKILIIFFILSLANVVLQTMKSILTVKSSKAVASIVTALAFAFYYVVIKQMADVDLLQVVIITIITNLIGVWFSIWFLDKTRKEQLWCITATIPVDEKLYITDRISYTKIIDASGKNAILDFYCKTRNETKLVVKSLERIESAKYCYSKMGELQ
jgi:hypothetical protein